MCVASRKKKRPETLWKLMALMLLLKLWCSEGKSDRCKRRNDRDEVMQKRKKPISVPMTVWSVWKIYMHWMERNPIKLYLRANLLSQSHRINRYRRRRHTKPTHQRWWNLHTKNCDKLHQSGGRLVLHFRITSLHLRLLLVVLSIRLISCAW